MVHCRSSRRFPFRAQQLHQLAKPARIQQGQRLPAEPKEVHHRAGGLVLLWDAGFEVLEGFRVVAPQHLQMCVDHSAQRRAGRHRSKRWIVSLADAQISQSFSRQVSNVSLTYAAQQLGTRVQQRIVQVGAEVQGLLDGRHGTVRIDETERTHQAAECVDSSRGEPARRLPAPLRLRRPGRTRSSRRVRSAHRRCIAAARSPVGCGRSQPAGERAIAHARARGSRHRRRSARPRSLPSG